MDSGSESQALSSEHTKLWALLLVKACERTGLLPLELRVFHRLIFFSNALAPIYHSHAPAELVMKRTWGPFYPKAQFDLDQLVLMGLVDISDISWEEDQEGVWKSAQYQITPAGFSLASDVTSASDRFMSTYRFLVDMCSAYSSIDDDKADEASRKDLIIAQPGYRRGAVIDFAQFKNNMSVRGIQAFVDSAPDIAKPNRQQQIRLYMKYLEGEAA